jgi:predicted secreted hydrolase
MQSLLTGSFTLANADGERLADAAVFSRAAVGLAGADERRVWIEDWAYNWADETLVVSTQDTALDLVLSAGEPATPGSEEGWYTYSIAGRATGRVNIAGEPAQVACAVTVAHRFGTF